MLATSCSLNGDVIDFFQGCERLEDWVQVFRDASKLLNSHVENNGPITSRAVSSGSGQPSDDDTPRKLLESVITAERRTKVEKILCNVEAAAMELGVLLQVCLILLPLYLQCLKCLKCLLGMLGPK